jgi:hypothetical protein
MGTLIAIAPPNIGSIRSFVFRAGLFFFIRSDFARAR